MTCSGPPYPQLCEPRTAPVSVQSAGTLTAELSVGGATCSDIRFHIYVDDTFVTTTNFVGPVTAGTSTTGPVDLGSFTPGTHTMSVQAEGPIGRM